MAQMPSMRKIEPHQSFMWSHNSLVDLEIGRTATEALHIDAPLVGIQPESLQRAGLTGEFDSIDVLVPAVIACPWIAFRVFVRHWRP